MKSEALVGNVLYWYTIQHKDSDMKLVMVETTHHDCMKQMLYMEVRDPRVPSSYDKAILIPMWNTAICVELEKFKKHNCLLLMHFDGQHLVVSASDFIVGIGSLKDERVR